MIGSPPSRTAAQFAAIGARRRRAIAEVRDMHSKAVAASSRAGVEIEDRARSTLVALRRRATDRADGWGPRRPESDTEFLVPAGRDDHTPPPPPAPPATRGPAADEDDHDDRNWLR